MRFALALVAALAAQWTNYPKTPDLKGPAPRSADGHPDLSGVWQADDQTYFFDLAAGLTPDQAVPLPRTRTLMLMREARQHGDDPLARCQPHGVPRINTNGLFPFKIVQTPSVVVIL